MKQIRTVVADDHAGFRAALAMFLSTLPEIKVVGVATDGEEALKYVDELAPDLLILDLAMPKIDGWQVLAHLRKRATQPHTIVLSIYSVPHVAPTVKARVVYAYLEKNNPRGLGKAINALAKSMAS
jgi:DNA-binding NarL/FixJ family response regulator